MLIVLLFIFTPHSHPHLHYSIFRVSQLHDDSYLSHKTYSLLLVLLLSADKSCITYSARIILLFFFKRKSRWREGTQNKGHHLFDWIYHLADSGPMAVSSRFLIASSFSFAYVLLDGYCGETVVQAFGKFSKSFYSIHTLSIEQVFTMALGYHNKSFEM